jgi:hypothetical protein
MGMSHLEYYKALAEVMIGRGVARLKGWWEVQEKGLQKKSKL